MSALANWYPGQVVLDFCVIVIVSVAAISGSAWFASLFLKRHAAVRHWILLSALICSLASPLLVGAFIASGRSFLVVPLLRLTNSTPVTLESPGAQPAPLDEAEVVVALPAAETVAKDAALSSAPALHAPAVNQPAARLDFFRFLVVTVFLAWLIGAVACILRLIRSGFYLHRLCQTFQPISDIGLEAAFDEARRLLRARLAPPVGISPLARTPVAAGFFRPVIVLPAYALRAINRDQLRDVLMHERPTSSASITLWSSCRWLRRRFTGPCPLCIFWTGS